MKGYDKINKIGNFIAWFFDSPRSDTETPTDKVPMLRPLIF